jgi:hypothetical protein
MHQAAAALAPEGKLRTWVEESFTHDPLREKDTGTKIEVLYAAYTLAAPPVHARVLRPTARVLPRTTRGDLFVFSN